MNRASLWIPLVVFIAMAFFLWRGFFLTDPHELPSALIDKPLPAFALPALDEPERTVVPKDLLGQPFLLNVWATWCPTCRAEHAELERIASNFGVDIVGVNYKDDPAEARVWLQRFGNPYRITVVDEQGSLGLDLGVYGAPETFLVDATGVIRYKRVGAIDQRVWEREIVPVLASLKGAPAQVQALASDGAQSADAS